MTTFELPGCVDMWTVLSGDQVIDLVSMNYDEDMIQSRTIQYNFIIIIKIYYVRKHKGKRQMLSLLRMLIYLTANSILITVASYLIG